MTTTPNQSLAPSRQPATKSYDAFKAFCKELWFIPLIAVIIAILILVIEHAHAQILAKFFSSFIYATLIGLPTAFLLNWIGFHYGDRFRRILFLIYSAALLLTAIAGSFVGAAVIRAVGIIPPGFYAREVRSSLPICLVITLVVGLSVTAYETLRHRLQAASLELRTQQMEHERANKLLAEARLSSLESRIHPHFLFNTLNSIASLVRIKPELAREMTVKLANILRALLKDHDTYVPLRNELSFTDDYLDIEVVRFGADKLRVEKEIDPDTLDVLVPSILLQPLIENSIKHGLEPRIHGGTVTLRSKLEGDRVLIEVLDDGVGMGDRPNTGIRRDGAGIGMKNVQERLEVLYGQQATFKVVSNPGRGTSVSIEIPADLPAVR